MAITISNSPSATGQNITTLSTTGITTSAGCVLVACGEWYTSSGTADVTISDSKGNTWTALFSSTQYQSNTRRIRAWYSVPTSTGAAHTFSLTRGAAEYTDANICVIELAGANTSSPIDSAAQPTPTTGNSTSPSITSGTFAQANNALIAFTGFWSTPTYTEASGWTNRANLDSGGDDEKMACATRITSATTAVSYAPTLSASTNWGAALIAVKEAASNTPPTFSGSITDQNATVSSAMISYNVSGKFSDGGDTLTYSKGGSWPDGVNLNSSTGVIDGTPTTAGTYTGLTVIATDTAAQAVSSNTFTITVASSGIVTVRRTIGNTGDYTTIQAWNNAAPADLTTSNIIWQGECQNQEFYIPDGTNSPNYGVSITGSTTDATRYKRLTTVSGASFRDHVNKLTNPLRYNASVGAAIRVDGTTNAGIAVFEVGFQLEGLQVKHTGSTGFTLWTSQLQKTIYKYNIFEGGTNYLVTAVSGAHDMINCAVIATNATSISRIAEGTAGVSWYSCVIASVGATATYGLIGGANSGTADGTVDCNFVNTAVFGCGQVREWNSPGTRTNNYTDGSTSLPSGFTVTTFDTSTGSGYQSITNGTHDLRLKTSSILVNAGTTDTAGGSVDIVGTTRTAPYDVGPWEAGGVFSLTAASGTYSLTGQNATLTYTPIVPGTNYTITAEYGAYNMTGVSARLTWSNEPIVIEKGPFTVSIGIKIGL